MQVNKYDGLPTVEKVMKMHCMSLEERLLAEDTTEASNKMCASTSFESSIGRKES